MRKLSKIALVVSLAVGTMLTGNVWATPVIFTPSVSGSSVTTSDSALFGSITAKLDLSATPFILGDGATQTLNFFTLTASGLSFNKSYTVAATLAFSDPLISSSGSGGGTFTTFCGVVSGGTLTWDTSTLPDYFTLADGNKIKIDFEGGQAVGFGNTAQVHAFVTNLGGGVAPVPEPGTILLLGSGLVGIFSFARMRMKG